MMSRKLRRAGFEASFFRPLRMKAYCIQGTQNMATRSEAPKMMDTATGNHFTKSYISPPMVTSMGKNVMLIARVALKIVGAYCPDGILKLHRKSCDNRRRFRWIPPCG